MRLLFCILLCSLLLISCQQRYGHVKKVRGRLAETVATQPGIPIEAQETTLVAHAPVPVADDPLKGAGMVSPESTLPETTGPKPVLPQREFVENLVHRADLLSFEQGQSLVLKTEEEVSYAWILMIAVFLVWIILLFFITSLVTFIMVLLLFFSFGPWGISIMVPPAFIAFSIGLLVLSLFLAFVIGRKRIRRKLGYTPRLGLLFRYFFIALGVTFVLTFLPLLFPTTTIVTTVTGIGILVLFLAALIYSWVYSGEESTS